MIRRIVSGGQTGADRAGLDVAIELGIPHGGWCPKGRLAEDGEVPARYELRETRTRNYLERTELNVCDSDGTVIFIGGALAGGSKRTQQFAIEAGKPCFVARLDAGADLEALVADFRAWLREHRVAVLDVAGSRESKSPGIYDAVKGFLMRTLDDPRPASAPMRSTRATPDTAGAMRTKTVTGRPTKP